jgi:hypothetical protein
VVTRWRARATGLVVQAWLALLARTAAELLLCGDQSPVFLLKKDSADPLDQITAFCGSFRTFAPMLFQEPGLVHAQARPHQHDCSALRVGCCKCPLNMLLWSLPDICGADSSVINCSRM